MPGGHAACAQPEAQSGRLQRIDLRLRSGFALEAFKSRMQSLLPEGVWLAYDGLKVACGIE